MSQTRAAKSVLVAGSTGLVGRECVDLLLANPLFTRIVALVRRSLPASIESERLKIEKVDFDRLEERPDVFAADCIICALGTTLKQAGSEALFRTVNYDYPRTIARIGIERGVNHFILVSSLGANPGSLIFYDHTRAEVESAIEEIGYRSYTIVRPYRVLGAEGERSLGMKLADRISPVLPAKFRPVRATVLATALVRAAMDDTPGKKILEGLDIR
jgi:uncharacterized protein YbjT (DUF2867 family)